MKTTSTKLHTLMDASTVLDIADLWRAPWEAIAEDATLLGVRMADDVWAFPDVAFQPFVTPGGKRIDFTKALPEGWNRDEQRSEAVLRRLKRMVRLYALSGVESRRRSFVHKGTPVRRALSMASVIEGAHALLKVARFALDTGRASSVADTCPDGHALFAFQEPADRSAFEAEGGKALKECQARFAGLVSDGLLTDWFPFAFAAKATTGKPLQNATDPLDDALFARLLQAALFWSKAGQDAPALMDKLEALGTKGMGDRLKAARLAHEAISSFRGQVLTPGAPFPYGLMSEKVLLRRLDEVKGPFRFVARVVLLAQCSNALLLATATGMRPLEINTLPRDALRRTAEGVVLSGLAFKGQDAYGGQDRDWPLPEVARLAVERQMALAARFDPGGERLWFAPAMVHGQASDFAISLAISGAFNAVHDDAGVPLCGPNEISIYRVRTSVARLMALSAQGGPLALLTVFGHKDITETMGYYRARGDFEQELSETITAVSRALGETMLAEHQAGVLPARTAKMVQTTLDGLGAAANIPQDGPDLFGSKLLVDAAEILGSGAEMVRPGVLCTARGTGQGLCATRTGARDVANCATACPYRFELAAALDDRRRVAETHLAQMEGLAPTEVFRLHFARTGLLAAIQGFEGPLAAYRTDVRVLDAVRPLLDTPQAVSSALSSTLSALFGDRP